MYKKDGNLIANDSQPEKIPFALVKLKMNRIEV